MIVYAEILATVWNAVCI